MMVTSAVQESAYCYAEYSPTAQDCPSFAMAVKDCPLLWPAHFCR